MLVFAALLVSVTQMFGGPTLLQPATYPSPSGEWSLSVDPSSRLGAGPAHYVMTRKGREVWSGDRPFAFCEAAVSDDGISAGYSFSKGQDSWGGELHVAILSASGEVVLDEAHERKGSAGPDGPPNPRVEGLFIQPQSRSFVVRVTDDIALRNGEEWWEYELATGHVIARVQPIALHETRAETQGVEPAQAGRGPLLWSIEARPIVDTPLTLVQWYSLTQTSGAKYTLGTRFVLCADDLAPVWVLDLPNDFSLPGDRNAEMRRLDELRRGGCILSTREPHRFELRLVADAVRVTFEVQPDQAAEHGWSVAEVARLAFVEPKEPSAADAPAIHLAKIASVPLGQGAAPETGPIRDIAAFDFDARGALRFVRREKEERTFSIVALDPAGELEHETRVGPIEAREGAAVWSPLTEQRWLLTISPWGPKQTSSAWLCDGVSGALTEFEHFDGPSIDAIERTSDGGFVMLGTLREEYTMTDVLARFANDGSKQWEHQGSFEHEEPSELFSPEDVTVTPNGSVVVLDNSRRLLQFFRADGEFERAIELAAAWGQEPSYPTDVYAQPDGGLLVRDFDGSPSWWRMTADGKVSAKFDLSRADGGKEFGDTDTMRIAPDGHLWSSDGRVFMRFDSTGHVDLELGRPADPHVLQEPSHVTIDTLGRVAIEDARTHALHFFAATGEFAFACVPDAADFEPSQSLQALFLRSDGELYVQPDDYADRFIEFDPRGHRVGAGPLGGERVVFRPKSSERWVAYDEGSDVVELRRIDFEGKVLQHIARRPDRRWLRDIEGIGVAASGALAVLDSGGLFSSGSRAGVSLYGPAGEPERVIELPQDAGRYLRNVSYGRRWIVLSDWSAKAWLISLPDGHVQRVSAPAADEQKSVHAFALSPDESELWCAQTSPPMLHRLALPK